MAFPRLIPSYHLYGDQAEAAWSESFNFEWIPQRSSTYHWVIQPHRHDTLIQLLHLTSGEVLLTLDDTVLAGRAPCLIVVPSGHVHGFRFSPDVNGPVVTAPQQPLESLAGVVMPALVQALRQPGLIPLGEGAPDARQLTRLFEALEHEARLQAPGQVAAGLSLLLNLMVQVQRARGAGSGAAVPRVSRKASQVERFRALVERDFRVQHTVQSYAARLSVTPGQLSRLCRDVLGQSSLTVIQKRILHEAQRELMYTSKSVKQLAVELGFEDDAYFSRFFRKHAQSSPRAFREHFRQRVDAARQPADREDDD
jgi:AraC family transcriptional activator of pobA